MSICGHEEVWKSLGLSRVQPSYARGYTGPRQKPQKQKQTNKNPVAPLGRCHKPVIG